MGVAYGCGRPDLLVYDTDLILSDLVDQGMSPEEAIDYFSYNIAGAWVGEGTPLFLGRLSEHNRNAILAEYEEP